MADSLKGRILDAFATRLAKITTANGYDTNVINVYSNEIPMGIQMNDYELPAIFLLDGPDNFITEHQKLVGAWDLRLQLWHNRVSDKTMMDFVRDVFKVIYADSPTAQRQDMFRGFVPEIHEVIPLSNSPDLNMIEANRVTELSFLVKYRTPLYDL